MTKLLHPGDNVVFDGADCTITVARVLDEQPLAADGIHFFIDQYGDQHMAERDDDTWFIVTDRALTDEQTDRASHLLYGFGHHA